MTREIDLVNLAMQGWVTQYDPVTAADAQYSPDLRNFVPAPTGALRLIKGYQRGPLTGTALGGAYVCLIAVQTEDLTSGVAYAGILYGGNGKLYFEQLAAVVSDDLAAGNTIYAEGAVSSTTLAAAGLDSNTYYEGVSYANYVYITNGTKNYRVFRDTTWQYGELNAGT